MDGRRIAAGETPALPGLASRHCGRFDAVVSDQVFGVGIVFGDAGGGDGFAFFDFGGDFEVEGRVSRRNLRPCNCEAFL
jgi:hypothetical protein